MKYIIIGTAGHVDHGKSAVIKALTSTDTDRLKEEKLRGISIDLGFATMELSNEYRVGIVDVPGHEHFLKNMLAGTGSIDVAMLIIAADEGIMPQTREHLAMLQLYGIQCGIVVINKIDKVDGEWLELVEEEVGILLKDTFLAHAPVCRVSAVTGEGISELKVSLLAEAKQVVPRDSEAPFRLWIDRVFTMKGYGPVVTGSVLSGTAKIGDSLILYPLMQQVRVRGTECHGSKINAVVAGQRAAINLVGVDKSELARGMSLSHDAYGQISTIWDVMAMLEQPIDSGTRVRLHVGTGEFLGRIYSFKDSSQQYMRIILEKPLAASAGDRGIIRLYSPQFLLGGIMLIAPGRKKRIIGEIRMALAQALKKQDVYNIVYQILNDSGAVLVGSEIKRCAGYINQSQVDESLLALSVERKIIMLDNYYIATGALRALTNHCMELLSAFHIAQPERAGLSREVIRQRLGIGDKICDKVAAYWKNEGSIVINGGYFALPEHETKYNNWLNDLLARSEQVLADSELTNIDVGLLGKKLNLLPEKAKGAFEILLNAGVLVQVDTICIYWKTMESIIGILHQHFQRNETITVGQLRDLINTSRKVALPLLEYLDMHKYTIRTGDIRRPGMKIKELSE